MKIELDMKINGEQRRHMESGTPMDLPTQLRILADELEKGGIK